MNCLSFGIAGASLQSAWSYPWKHPNGLHANQGYFLNAGKLMNSLTSIFYDNKKVKLNFEIKG